jgi:hypothetical protein
MFLGGDKRMDLSGSLKISHGVFLHRLPEIALTVVRDVFG